MWKAFAGKPLLLSQCLYLVLPEIPVYCVFSEMRIFRKTLCQYEFPASYFLNTAIYHLNLAR